MRQDEDRAEKKKREIVLAGKEKLRKPTELEEIKLIEDITFMRGFWKGKKVAQAEMIQSISGYFKNTGQLQKTIRGAIIDTLNVHETINKQGADSMARRITKQVFGLFKSWFKLNTSPSPVKRREESG